MNISAKQIKQILGPDHLRAVVALAEYESFTLAADELDISQPSMSRRITEIEAQFPQRIFERTTRRLAVSPYGRDVVTLARDIVRDYDHGWDELDRLASGATARVTVACLPSVAAVHLPQCLKRFRKTYPKVHIEVQDATQADTIQAVRSGEADIGIATFSAAGGTLSQDSLGYDTFSCVLPMDHALTDADVVTWNDLADHAFVSFGPHTSITQAVTQALEGARVSLRPATTASTIGAVAGLVEAGIGITAVPGLVAPLMSFASLELRPITPEIRRDLCVSTRGKQLSTAAHELAEIIRTTPLPQPDRITVPR